MSIQSRSHRPKIRLMMSQSDINICLCRFQTRVFHYTPILRTKKALCSWFVSSNPSREGSGSIDRLVGQFTKRKLKRLHAIPIQSLVGDECVRRNQNQRCSNQHFKPREERVGEGIRCCGLHVLEWHSFFSPFRQK